MTDAKTVAELAAKGTQGEWVAFNMTHSDGRPMTPEELGEYVTNSVRMSDETRFLFISGRAENGRDIDVCHIGNGPKGPYNAQRIANVPAMEDLIAEQAAQIEALTGGHTAAYLAGHKDASDRNAPVPHSIPDCEFGSTWIADADGFVPYTAVPRVKPLEWVELRNNTYEAAGYQVCHNNDDFWRVRRAGRVICKKIKGFSRAKAWVFDHHERRILSALDMEKDDD